MTRLHRDFLGGSLSSAVSASGTGSDVLHSAAFVSVGLVTAPDVLAVSLNPDGLRGEAPEIVHVTSHALGANTVLAARGQEGTARRAWPSGTPWVHALTALDADSAASGGGGAGITFGGTPPPVVTTLGDVTTAGSWWGAAAVRFVTWTPTKTGWVHLLPAAADADTQERDYVVFRGTVANTDYPDGTDASGSWDASEPFDGSIDVEVYSGGSNDAWFPAVAGTTYTVAVVYWGSGPYTARSISLTELHQSLEPLGGITPVIKPASDAAVVVQPDGSLAIGADRPDPAAGSTVDATSIAAGSGNTASDGSIAAGSGSTASGHSIAVGAGASATGGDASAFGNSVAAAGPFSHAEGDGGGATGEAAHSEGGYCTADGAFSHAQGNHGSAFRPMEHAQGGGFVGGGSNALQASRLVLQAATVDATPTLLQAGTVPPRLNYGDATAVTGLVTGRTHPGSTHAEDVDCASWRIDALVVNGADDACILVGHTVTALFHTTGAAAWTCGFGVDTTGNDHSTPSTAAYKVTVTGAAATGIDWGCFLDLLEVR